MRLRSGLFRLGVTAILIPLAPPAEALPPDQIYERASPAVWSVKAYGADERLLASASGVVVAPGKLVTSCQVLARARQVQLRNGNTIFDAKLEYPDVERDLCQLDVPGMSVAPLAAGTARGLRTGQRLYVIGFSRGNQQSLGEGLVSAISDEGTGKERIQTSVPASPGLLGAAVFNEEGRLVGIATNTPKDAPATVFAVPADWIAELASRGQAALAARTAAPAAASAPSASTSATAPGMPAAGATWTYAYLEKAFGRRQIEVTVRALRVDGAIVEEAVTSATGGGDTRRVVNAPEWRFVVHPLSRSASVVELSPYLLAASAGKAPAEDGQPSGYPIESPGLPSWIAKATIQGWEQVAVPAGTFRALRVDVTGRRSAPIGGRSSFSGTFKMSVWYAQDVRRIVRLEQKVWTADGISPMLGADEVLELLSYRTGP